MVFLWLELGCSLSQVNVVQVYPAGDYVLVTRAGATLTLGYEPVYCTAWGVIICLRCLGSESSVSSYKNRTWAYETVALSVGS